MYPGTDGKAFNPLLIYIVFHIARMLSFSEYKFKVIVISILRLSIASIKTCNSCYEMENKYNCYIKIEKFPATLFATSLVFSNRFLRFYRAEI